MLNRFVTIFYITMSVFFMLSVSPCAVAGVIRVPFDFDSIQSAVNAAVVGDTVLIQGTRDYFGSIELKSGVALRGFEGRPVIVGRVIADRVTGVLLQGLTVRGQDANYFYSGFYLTDSEVVIEDCVCTSAYEGINVLRSDVFIDACLVEKSWLDGVRIVDSEAVIANCTIRENTVGTFAPSVFGLHIGEGSNVQVSGSTVTHNERGIWVHSSTVDMVHTVIAFNEDFGLSIQSQADLEVDHCTIAYNANRDVYVLPGIDGAEIRNSIIWNDQNSIFDQSGIPIAYSIVPEPIGGEGNIAFDPYFVDGANGDFRLRSTSVCIDRGEPGVFDPDGTRNDMGAFFFDQRTYDPPPPAFIAAAGGDQHVMISWPYEVEPFLTTFNIFRSETTGFPVDAAHLVAQVEPSAASFVDAGLSNEVMYYYRVTGTYQLGYESPPTDEIAAIPGIAPVLEVDAERMDFGTVVAGDARDETLRLSNTGNGVLRIGSLRIPGPGVFSVVDETTAFEIPPGEDRLITVQFRPPRPQPYSGRLEIASSSAEGTTLIDLTGRGVADVQALPNPFTPNGDGFNDVVTFGLPPHERYDIRLFDRAGREVRRIGSPDPSRWDGRDRSGRVADPGVYIYVVAIDGETTANGTITLIR